ncbi:transposase InsO family protein [Bradyrhizobium sp. LB1.3]
MRLQALRARPRRRRLPKDEGDRQIATIPLNLLDRQFMAARPNQKRIADFTYIWTAEGWLCVSAVIDLFSRRVVGWSMNASMTAQLVADALLMAVWRRGKPDALMHHSDRGSQYASEQFQRLMADSGIVCSMRIRQRLGQCGDGELLLVAEDRAHRAQNLPHQERGQSRCIRLH